MGANATLEQRRVAVEPGGEAAVRVRVRNAGQVVDQFALQVLGATAAWATVEPPTLSLFPGAEETATIRFRPPRDSTVAAGDVPFGVRVVSHEDPQGVAVEEGALGVGAFRQTSADMVPRSSRASRSATHELSVDNRGNVPIQVAVQGADPNSALTFGFRPPAATIEPGRAAHVRVRVTARRAFLSGQPRPHAFQLQVMPDGEAAIPVDGAMTQEPLVGRVARNVAVGALLALVGLVALWFLLVRPTVQSAAREAVATPLAQQSSAIAQLRKQAAENASGSGSGSTPSPTAGAGGSGTGGSGAAGGAAFGRRLDQSGGGKNQYKVPAGTTVSVTDVVFQNPAGEHGTVQLQRDGTTLLVENLDNFRDLDYHFVSPITLSANQTIQMSVQCPSGCPGVGVYLNGVQRPS